MEKQNLIKEIIFTFKLFLNVIIAAVLGFIFSFILNLDAITGYKFIINCAIIGAANSILIILKRFK